MYPLVGKINAQHKSNNHTYKFYDVSFGFEGGQVDVYFPSLSEWPVFPIGPLNLAIHQRLEWPLTLVILSVLYSLSVTFFYELITYKDRFSGLCNWFLCPFSIICMFFILCLLHFSNPTAVAYCINN